jgi:hypothetical protein
MLKLIILFIEIIFESKFRTKFNGGAAGCQYGDVHIALHKEIVYARTGLNHAIT